MLGIVDSWGNEVVSYTYDAWGNLLTTTGSMAGTLGKLNPLRYRGYVYDDETGLYYLKTRYYNPAWGRFINADSPAVPTISPGSATWDKNLFAYCDNNPVTRKDDGGQCWHLLVGAAVGLFSQYVSDVTLNLMSGQSFADALKPKSTWADYGAAALSGALAASGVGAVWSVAGNAAIGGFQYLANCDIKSESITTIDLVGSIAIGGLTGLAGGKGANGKALRGVYNRSAEALRTAVSPKKIAIYTAKQIAVKQTAIKAATKTFALGIASNYAHAGRRIITHSLT